MDATRGLLVSVVTALMVVACGDEKMAPAAVYTPPPINTPPPPEVTADLPASTIAQMKVLVEEKEARNPAQRKISSQLLYAKSDRFPALKQGMQKGEAQTNQLVSHLRYDDRGRVLCDVKGDVDAGLERQIEIAGGAVVVSSAQYHSSRAWLPLETLESLAGQPVVKTIRPAFAATTHRADPPFSAGKYSRMSYEQRVANAQAALKLLRESPVKSRKAAATGDARTDAITNAGAANSEGGIAHGADRARKFYAADGTGVKVGVLSDSDDFKEESIASGDLPADTVTIPGQDGRPGSGEGTAMLQIVHDIAPGAKLFFATAFNSPESFAENIRALRFTYHADIIIDDVQYYFESPYQDDIVAAAVEDVVADGATYYSSAGNSGNFDDGTSGTWEGDFKSGGTFNVLPSGYQVLDFGKKVISNRIELGGGPIVLHWSDPGSLDNPLSSNDYDVFILAPDLRSVAAASTDIQDGDDIPFEFLDFDVPAEYRLVVAAKTGAATRAVRLQIFGGEFGIATVGAVYGHAAAKDAFAIAAVDVASAGTGEFTAGPTTQVELYSSDGNRTVFYDRLGTKIGIGEPTFAGAAGEVRKKPETSAADGVSTTLPSSTGLNPFFGTSAAAPHAGAIAALIKSAVPTVINTKIYSSLKAGSVDIEAAGVDIDSGSGVISAFNSLQKAGAKPAVFLDLGASTTTPTSGTAVVPGGGGSLTVQLINNGGAPATAVRTQLTTTTPGVTVTSGLSNYPNIAAGGSATNTTPFTFTVSSAVPCGTRILFTLSVAFTGKGGSPTVFIVPVQTGSPGASFTTSYSGSPVAIPDNNPAGVNIPLAISGSSLSQIGFSFDGTSCSAAIGATTVGLDHTWIGDLTATLQSPAGTRVTLLNRAGGSLNSGNNLCQTVLADSAVNSIQSVTSAGAPYTGTFKPASPLSAFAGESSNGTWVLNVNDNAATDTGTVRAFSVKVTGFSCAAP
jgi:subtilisin-like proprotein convertase family protein